MTAGNRSPRILIMDFPARSNLGCYALLQGTISLLRIAFPSSEITIHSPSGSDCISGIPVKGGILTYNARNVSNSDMVMKMVKASFRLLVHLFSGGRLGDASSTNGEASPIRDYENSDIVVNTGGDLLTEDYGSLSLYWWAFHTVAALILKKKVVLFGESLGPYNRLTNRLVMAAILRRCALILVRESISESIALELGVPRNRVFRIPDPSFAVGCSQVNGRIVRETASRGSRKGVVISPSSIAWQYSPANPGAPDSRYSDYLETLTAIISRFVENGVGVRLLPHVRGDTPFRDDVALCQELAAKAKSPSVTIVDDANTPDDVRAVIGGCELLVALRMHAALAGYAVRTPTISIGYSHKFDGISKELTGSGQWFYDLRRSRLNAEHRSALVEWVWEHWLDRNSHNELLEQKMEGLCEQFASGIKKLQELHSGSF